MNECLQWIKDTHIQNPCSCGVYILVGLEMGDRSMNIQWIGNVINAYTVQNVLGDELLCRYSRVEDSGVLAGREVGCYFK